MRACESCISTLYGYRNRKIGPRATADNMFFASHLLMPEELSIELSSALISAMLGVSRRPFSCGEAGCSCGRCGS